MPRLHTFFSGARFLDLSSLAAGESACLFGILEPKDPPWLTLQSGPLALRHPARVYCLLPVAFFSARLDRSSFSGVETAACVFLSLACCMLKMGYSPPPHSQEGAKSSISREDQRETARNARLHRCLPEPDTPDSLACSLTRSLACRGHGARGDPWSALSAVPGCLFPGKVSLSMA